jgi:Ca2+-transporting ATPase
MREAPRSPKAPLLDELSLRFVLITAVLKAAVAGALLLGLPSMGASVEATRTAVFLYTAVAQLAFAYPARRLGSRPLTNAALHLAIVLGVALQLGTVLLPGLRHALGLTPLDASVWVLTALAITLTWALAEGTALVLNRFDVHNRTATAEA